jgi:predicted transcriptional regulator of viral defense system
VPREYLLRLMRQGVIRGTGRGVYEVSDAKPTEDHSVAAKEVPKGVICLLSAVRFHDLTTQQHPSKVWIGIPVRSRSPRLSTTARLVRYSEKTLAAGVEVHQLESVPVRIFSVGKTVADCFKYRNKIGLDVALEALKDALKRKRATVDEIERHALIWRVSRIVRPYLEALA